jgi:hypothetical protein
MIPMPGGTILNLSRAVWPHLRKRYRSLLRAYSSSTLRSRAAEDVGDDGMVGDELGRDHRVHRLRVSSQAGQRVAHGGEVDQGGHPVGVVQEHPRRVQVDLVTAVGGGIPAPHRLDLLGRDHLPVLMPQQVLQQHLEGERQVVDAQPVQPVQLPPATAEHHRITGSQAIHGPPSPPGHIGGKVTR